MMNKINNEEASQHSVPVPHILTILLPGKYYNEKYKAIEENACYPSINTRNNLHKGKYR